MFHHSFHHSACLLLMLGSMIAWGCGGGDSTTTNNVNPYADNTGPSSPPTVAPRRSVGTTGGGGRPSTGGTAARMRMTEPEQAIEVPKAGYAAEMAVPLALVDYLKMARKSAEMLIEMSRIHATVSESGDAADFQDRWGELTAAHTKLAREVAGSAYPPAKIARELNEVALPKLTVAIDTASAVMEKFADVEGGLKQPHAQAIQIFNHLSKNLPSTTGDEP